MAPPRTSSKPSAGPSKGKLSLGSSAPSTSRNGGSAAKKRTSNGKAKASAEVGSDDDDDYGLDEEGDDDAASASGSDDTEDEIENAKDGKSKKTQKRKRRAVSPTSFGEALSAFLGDEDDEAQAAGQGISESTATKSRPSKKPAANQAPIFALAPSVRSRISSTQLNAKASRIALEERRKQEEQYRVKDLIGGWGKPGERPGRSDTAAASVPGQDSDGEEDAASDAWLRDGGSKGYERRLRKVAQRGVVKLFNAIRAAQSTTDEDLQENKDKTISSSTQSSSTRPGQDTVSGKNALGGKSKELADLSKNNFLDMIRSGAKA